MLAIKKAQGIISKEIVKEKAANKQDIQDYATLEVTDRIDSKRGIVLPFTPLVMSFNNINYYVDMPLVRTTFTPLLSL